MNEDQQSQEIVEQEFLPRNDAAESVRELFKDSIDEDSNRRSIDLKTELTDQECKIYSRLDFLQHAGVFRNVDILTHSLSRRMVSKGRKGRGEAVEMFKNLLPSQIRKTGFWGRMVGGSSQH